MLRVALLLLSACTTTVDPIVERVEEVRFPIVQPKQLDLLFVIDDSPEMAPRQATLLASYPQFINVLNTIEGGLPSVQIAVTTTSFVLRGPLVDVRFADGSHQRNYTGSLADAFTALADVGANGATITQPLEAMRRALLAPGFVRENVVLAVIFVAGHDDASPATLDEYDAELRVWKRDTKDIVVSAALVPAAVRLRAFLERFPDRNTITSLDQEDLTGVMQMFFGFGPHLADPCLYAELAEPLQCTVEYVFPDGTREALALCDGVRVPCWQVLADPVQCPQALGGRLAITNAPVILPPQMVVEAQCLAR